ncbi:hypothetical protein M408DRAFT_31835, partial [Serendipita vermifera MAFF 305830]
LSPGTHLRSLSLADSLIQGERLDSFHNLTHTYESGRLGARGYFDGLLAGGVIGFPPILDYGSPTIKFAIIPGIVQPKKVIYLTITEGFS